ncbi:MAG: hypothetical protein QM589_06010 [Thermomicrobiales bacterium]
MTARILIVGSPRDPTYRYTLSTPMPSTHEIVALDLDRFAAESSIHLDGELGATNEATIVDGDNRLDFGRISACYARFIDPRPESDTADDKRSWARHRLLQLVLADAPFPVVNRPGAGESNDMKPVHTALLGALGFAVPRSCTTNDRDEALSFLESCPDGAIYKSNSGQRSIVQLVGPADIDRLGLLDRCPVYFQERIRGTDIRVHVIGNHCHAVAIDSNEIDYRYDRSGTAQEHPFAVPDDLCERCIRATEGLGLVFAGIDLIQREDGEFVALEANPMPGYHGYDLTLGGAIAASLWSWLANA